MAHFEKYREPDLVFDQDKVTMTKKQYNDLLYGVPDKITATKDRVIKILLKHFGYVDCDTCKYSNTPKNHACSQCKYDQLNWSLSKSDAEYIVDEILGDEYT